MEKLSPSPKTHTKTASTDINLIRIEDLIKTKTNRISPIFRSCHVQESKNQKEMKVISPFYDRTKCISKGPCFCPFHRKKRGELASGFYRKGGASKNDPNDDAFRKGYRKLKTEENELKLIRSKQFLRQNCLKSTNLISANDKQNYNAITHKVECRNSEFEYFLKKNQLYILTGKLPNPKNGQEMLEVQAFLQSLSKHGESIQELLHQQKDNNSRKNSQSRKLTRKNIFYKQFGQDGFISKVRKLIQSVLNGTKNMGIKQMEKLRAVFSNLLEQQRQFEGETITYFKNKQCLEKFNQFIQNQLHPKDKCLRNDAPNSKLVQTNKYFQPSGKKRQSASNQIIVISMNAKNVKQGQINRSSLISTTGPDYEMGQNEKEFTELKNNKINSNHFKQTSKQRFLQKNEKNIYQITENDQQKKNSKKQVQNQTRNRKNFLHKANHQSLFRENYLKQFQHERDSNQITNDLRNDQNYYLHNSGHKKNEKQAKLGQILNQIKQDTKVDENYLQMKKYIERNKRFLRKMQMKLNDLNLGVFVIEPSDSLITRKKKIRCLKELVAKQNNQKEGVYDEIMKYLDIYTEHCNMLLKREIKKNEQEIYFEYLEEDQVEILTSKDFTKSLKFISLHQNEEYEKENKLQWWISIPQYVTNDWTRQKKYDRFQQSIQIIQKSTKQNPAEISQISDDSLVQKQLDNKCKVKIIRENQKTIKALNSKPNKKQMNRQGKLEKIKQRYGCTLE